MLVATDIAARGIHVDEIDLVVHVEPPQEHKAYLHRSGRTARAGASGIVVTVGHERDHQGRAEEHFLPAGPFAILPLTGKRSSLVWTEKRAEAARVVALGHDEFPGERRRRLGLHPGEIQALDKRTAVPPPGKPRPRPETGGLEPQPS